MRLCWQFAPWVSPTFRAGSTGETLQPGTNLLPAHCTERDITLKAQGKGFVLMCVWGFVESDWHCLRLLDKRVVVRVRAFCPKVEHHPKTALPSHQTSLWWALLLSLEGQGRMLSCYSRSVTGKLLHSSLHVLVSRSLCFLVLSGQGECMQRASWLERLVQHRPP